MRVILREAGEEYRIAGDRRIRTLEDAAEAAREIVTSDTEVMVVLCLNTKMGLMSSEIVTSGLLDSSLVHPREVFRSAVKNNSATIVLVHNHPSGDPTPSAEDIRITRQLVEAGKIIDIKVLDHVVVSPPNSRCSMREDGLVSFQ